MSTINLCEQSTTEKESSTEPRHSITPEELLLNSTAISPQVLEVNLYLENIHCGGCIQRIETSLSNIKDVVDPRVNLGTKTVAIRLNASSNAELAAAKNVLDTLNSLGFSSQVINRANKAKDRVLDHYLKALAVSALHQAT